MTKRKTAWGKWVRGNLREVKRGWGMLLDGSKSCELGCYPRTRAGRGIDGKHICNGCRVTLGLTGKQRAAERVKVDRAADAGVRKAQLALDRAEAARVREAREQAQVLKEADRAQARVARVRERGPSNGPAQVARDARVAEARWARMDKAFKRDQVRAADAQVRETNGRAAAEREAAVTRGAEPYWVRDVRERDARIRADRDASVAAAAERDRVRIARARPAGGAVKAQREAGRTVAGPEAPVDLDQVLAEMQAARAAKTVEQAQDGLAGTRVRETNGHGAKPQHLVVADWELAARERAAGEQDARDALAAKAIRARETNGAVGNGQPAAPPPSATRQRQPQVREVGGLLQDPTRPIELDRVQRNGDWTRDLG